MIYTLVGKAGQPREFLAALAALLFTLVLQGWKRRADVSIVAGTAVYMLLVNLW